MNKLKYIKLLTLTLSFGLIVGCNDGFLDRQPLDTIVASNFYQTDEQLYAGAAPLYNIVWFGYNSTPYYGLGDARGGSFSKNYSFQLENIEFRTTATTTENTDSWRSFYNVVGQANTLIENVEKYAPQPPKISEAAKRHVLGEARFMRGLAYSYLVQNYGAVPIITKNTSTLQDTTIARNTVESVWEFICRDLKFAIENLSATPIKNGRITSWAAKAMLSKMYLTRAGVGKTPGSRDETYLDSARILSRDVIENSPYSLMPEYEDLFKIKFNNNAETIFALQWVYNGNYGTQNRAQSFLAYSNSVTGFDDGWGADLGASKWILGKYEGLLETGKTIDKRRKATFMLPGEHYNYIHQKLISEEKGEYVQELVVPIGTSGYNNRAWVKKYVVGRPEDNDGRVLSQGTEINTYIMRLAEVYLIYAEAVMGNSSSTTDALAVNKFTELRKRAGLTWTNPSITWDNVFNERVVELAMEGNNWYDFVRLHYYDPQKAYSILSEQDKGFLRITPNISNPTPLNPATSWTIADDPESTARKIAVNGNNFMLPIPESELSKAPNLRKPPVEYDFNQVQ